MIQQTKGHSRAKNAKYYSDMTIIQKINVKANAVDYGLRFTGRPKNFKAMNIAINDFAHHTYDTPFYFSGNPSLY